MKLLIHILKEELLFLVVIKVVFSQCPQHHWKLIIENIISHSLAKICMWKERVSESRLNVSLPKICQLSPCIHLTKVKFCHIRKSRLCWVTNFWIKLSCHYSISWYKLDCFIRISRPEKGHKCIHVKLWDKIRPKTKMSPIKSDT